MVKLEQKAKKVGGSIMIRIPKHIVDEENIKDGELIQLDVQKVKQDWFGAFPKLTPFAKEDRARSKYE